MGYSILSQHGKGTWGVAELVLDSEDDLETLDIDNYYAGTAALVATTGDVYILTTDKQWVKIGG